jgi:hypothetical protein
MNAQFLEGLENTLILAGEELADHQQSKVRHLDSENQYLIFNFFNFFFTIFIVTSLNCIEVV